MFCVDCMVEDLVNDTPAITVAGGFALCLEHLKKFAERQAETVHKNSTSDSRVLNVIDGFLGSFEE